MAGTGTILHTKTKIKSVLYFLHTTYTNVTHEVLAEQKLVLRLYNMLKELKQYVCASHQLGLSWDSWVPPQDSTHYYWCTLTPWVVCFGTPLWGCYPQDRTHYY